MSLDTPSRSVLRRRSGDLCGRPSTTTTSADFSLRLTPSPFRAQGEISPGKGAHSFAAQPPDLRRLTFGHESFAALCPLALVGAAFYPVLVHRLAASLHASSPHSVALVQLRFASFAVTNLRRDFHPQECAHAGRTMYTPKRMRFGVLPARAGLSTSTSRVASSTMAFSAGRHSSRANCPRSCADCPVRPWAKTSCSRKRDPPAP